MLQTILSATASSMTMRQQANGVPVFFSVREAATKHTIISSGITLVESK